MVAIRIGPDGRLIVVAAPAYFDRHPVPETPQDLMKHRCINLRLATQGGLYPWEFKKDNRSLNVRVDGQLVFNSVRPMVAAALAGFGLAFLPEDIVRDDIHGGKLIQVLDDWCPSFSGYHLYYPSRRHTSPAFKIISDTLRFRS